MFTVSRQRCHSVGPKPTRPGSETGKSRSRSVRFGNFEKPVYPGTGSVCTFIETDSVRFYFVIKVGYRVNSSPNQPLDEDEEALYVQEFQFKKGGPISQLRRHEGFSAGLYVPIYIVQD